MIFFIHLSMCFVLRYNFFIIFFQEQLNLHVLQKFTFFHTFTNIPMNKSTFSIH